MPKREFINYENGLYALSVSAVDSFGNVGIPAVKYFALNKYIYKFILVKIYHIRNMPS